MCNILALEDKYNTLYDEPNFCQPFKINSGEVIITYEIKVHTFQSSLITSARHIRLIDIPGLNCGRRMDTSYINDIMAIIKKETDNIKLFPIVINGETRLSQKSTIDTI